MYVFEDKNRKQTWRYSYIFTHTCKPDLLVYTGKTVKITSITTTDTTTTTDTNTTTIIATITIVTATHHYHHHHHHYHHLQPRPPPSPPQQEGEGSGASLITVMEVTVDKVIRDDTLESLCHLGVTGK